MATHHFDQYGNRMGSSRTGSEIWGERILEIILIAIVLPFVPLFYVSHLLFVFLTASIGMHELFALIRANCTGGVLIDTLPTPAGSTTV